MTERCQCRQLLLTPQSGNQVSTSLGNSGLCWTIFARNRDTAVPAEGNGDLETLICVLVARPRRCLTLSNPVPWQNWMAAYLGYTLRMKTLFRGWPITVNDTHTRRRRLLCSCLPTIFMQEFTAEQWPPFQSRANFLILCQISLVHITSRFIQSVNVVVDRIKRCKHATP